MIKNNHVDATFAKRRNGFDGSRAAIHGEEQGRRIFVQAVFHAVGAQAVTFVHPVGQIEIHAPVERTQDFEQQRGGGYAVHVVIAKNHQRFILFAGAEQSPDGGVHVRQQKRVGEIFQPGLEKVLDDGRFAETSIDQALGEQRRDFELRRQLTGEERLRRRGGPAEFHFILTTDEHR